MLQDFARRSYFNLLLHFVPWLLILWHMSTCCFNQIFVFVSLSLQVFVNFAKQQSREDESIVLHPKAAGAQRYIDTTPIKSLGR